MDQSAISDQAGPRGGTGRRRPGIGVPIPALALILIWGCGGGNAPPANSGGPTSRPAAEQAAAAPEAAPETASEAAPATTETEPSEGESAMTDRITKTDAEWRAELTPEQYRVLRGKGTERAFTGEYHDNKKAGRYLCAGCGLELYSSTDKFDSGTGWPSFTRAVDEGHIATETDSTLGMVRTELLCARCGGHLGHSFPDGPPPTGMRHCINSVSLEFKPEGE